MSALTMLKKLYLNDNFLNTLPMEMWKLHATLIYLSAGGNPWDA